MAASTGRGPGIPDVATEVCDGRPSDVQGDRDYWVNTVGRFCPWAAKVVEEGLR
jgi:hypothetical protein